MSALRIILISLGALLLLVATMIVLGKVLAQSKARSMAASLLAAEKKATGTIVTEADLAPLPEPVQRWMRWAKVVGRERVRTVRLRQVGELRQAIDKPWMPLEAEQYYTVDPPAFIWYANVRLGFIPFMQGRDSYIDGHGNMLIKIGGWFVVADGHGPKLDQGTLLRYLSEIIWFPSAALASYITWSPVDSNSARATMSYGGVTASALFIFDAEGKPVDLRAERYYAEGSIEQWSTPSTAYGEFQGVRMPTKGEAIWKLKSGDLSYIRLEITEVELNVDETY